MNIYEAIKTRRSRYDINHQSPISNQRIEEIVRDCITYVPSAFDSQSSRVLLLFGDRHDAFWEIVKSTLKALVPEATFPKTEEKIDSFKAGHGTILFFEDMATITQLQTDFVAYAENFPIWSHQSAGMLQYAVWTALSTEGLGASIQHYNPIVDEAVAKEFNIPTSWKLLGQMPFGSVSGKLEPKSITALDERFVVLDSAND